MQFNFHIVIVMQISPLRIATVQVSGSMKKSEGQSQVSKEILMKNELLIHTSYISIFYQLVVKCDVKVS